MLDATTAGFMAYLETPDLPRPTEYPLDDLADLT